MESIIRKEVFGKKFFIVFHEDKFSKIIKRELSVYPEYSFEKNQADYVIDVDDKFQASENEKYGRNPKEVYVAKDCLCINYSWGIVSWGKKSISVSFNPTYMSGGLMGLLRRFLDIQFYSQVEWAGQRLYEDILINVAFWDKDYFVLHGSGICDNKGNVVVIGGTGGTGKTSTVLSMKGRKDRIFVCDDLSAITKEGKVFVNYDKPKIYAYNLIGNPEFENQLLSKESFISKIQWKILKAGNPAKVRRRVAPGDLYTLADPTLMSNLRLHTYLILNRTMDVSDIIVSNVEKELAANMTIEIMRTEFAKFAAFLNYNKLNGLYKGDSSYPDSEECFNNWKCNMINAFGKINIKLVSIPFDYDNEKLKVKMNEIIDNILL